VRYFNDLTRNYQLEWLSWNKDVLNDDGLIYQVRCKIYSCIEKKNCVMAQKNYLEGLPQEGILFMLHGSPLAPLSKFKVAISFNHVKNNFNLHHFAYPLFRAFHA
jgi:hypothetical protein